MPLAECNGICLTGYDVGIESGVIAYPHPTCPAHGLEPDHPFQLDGVDGHGHEYCVCGAVRASHAGEVPCVHAHWRNGHCFDCGFHGEVLDADAG